MTSSWSARSTSSSARWSPRKRWRASRGAAHFAVLFVALGRSAEAQAGYTAAQFDTTRFVHSVQSEVQTVVAGRERRERISVVGVLVVDVRPDSGHGLGIEAWFDSLAVRRISPEGALEPDTDGLIGGRYRGLLDPRGAYTARARPFVPDGVAEVVDVSGTMEDFLPLLPPAPLRVGERWSDGEGLELRRVADSVADTLLRFEARRTRRADAVTASGDTALIPAAQVTRETEEFAWHRTRGLVRRVRSITVETTIPAGPGVGPPVRSRVEQRITSERVSR
jgi:hypothetical protein